MMDSERFDYQQQEEQDRRREEEELAWNKHWRETWARWAEQSNKENSNAEH